MTADSRDPGAGAALAPDRVDAIVMGGSAGAIGVLLEFLPRLPSDLCVPVLMVLHLPAENSSPLPGLFALHCSVPVQEATDKQRIEPGVVLLAPPDCHLLVEPDFTVAFSVDQPVHHSRPSIDVLFESAAWAWHSRVLGILLSGANTDGAAGLAAIADAGGLAWVQDPGSAASAVMPLAGLSATPAARALSIASMGDAVSTLSRAARRRE